MPSHSQSQRAIRSQCTEHKDGTRLFITDSDANTYLRSAARTAHDISTGDANLDTFSTHSIRVTACNLLHRQTFSDSYIQNRLRWKSKCFNDYLHNTFYNAVQHTIPLSGALYQALRTSLHDGPINRIKTLSKQPERLSFLHDAHT